MGQMTRYAYGRLDALIEDLGDDGLLALIADRVSMGEALSEIAKNIDLKHMVMREWLEGDKNRMNQIALAKRCFAEDLVYEGLQSVRDADQDTVQLAKLQFESYSKTAGKIDRDAWGEKQQVEVTNVHAVDFRGLLDSREKKLMEMLAGNGGAAGGGATGRPGDGSCRRLVDQRSACRGWCPVREREAVRGG